MRLNVFSLINLLFVVSPALADEKTDSKCVELTAESFAENINDNNHFVMFYAPWCSHCKRLHPTWDELAEMLNYDGSRVTIAKVDCIKETAICSQQDITGYPTLKYFSAEKLEPVKFKGTRDMPSLTTFLNEQLGSNLVKHGDEDHQEEKGSVELTDETYVSHLSTGKHFVKFYAPWCGHCQSLAPTWEAVGVAFADHPGVSIAKIDCTVSKGACGAYDIKSYPTLLWIEDGEKVEKYPGYRTQKDLSAYVSDRLGDGVRPESDKPVEPPPSPVVTLTNENFHSAISNGITFVKFFAPWCGHCKGLAPTWEDLGKRFSTFETISIAKVDCTTPSNKELCNEQEVDGFPTLLLYKDGEKIEEHTGGRGLEELYDFVVGHGKRLNHDEL